MKTTTIFAISTVRFQCFSISYIFQINDDWLKHYLDSKESDGKFFYMVKSINLRGQTNLKKERKGLKLVKHVDFDIEPGEV